MRRVWITLFVAVGLSSLALYRTEGFSLGNIKGALFAKAEGATPKEVEEILKQPFAYMSKGRQCFVFLSRDGKYVLKFFNQRYLSMPWYGFLLKEGEKAKRKKREMFYKTSYPIAFQEFGEEILYLHLGPSESLPSVSIKDPTNQELFIDLNNVPFVLQKKGQPLYPTLLSIYEKEGIDRLYLEIDHFLEAIEKRIAKQIADGDNDVMHNWGYCDGSLFHLDPGRLYFDPSLKERKRAEIEWRRATFKFHRWLKKNIPEASPYFEKSLKSHI